MTDDFERAAKLLAAARDLALRVGRPDLAALALNYLGIARFECGEPDGLRLLRQSIAESERAPRGEFVARGHCNLAELLLRAGRLDELETSATDGPALRARARLLVARLQPRGAPLRRADAARPLGRRAGRPARARRGRGRPGHAVRLQRPVARAPARAARRRARRRACSAAAWEHAPPAAAAAGRRVRRAGVREWAWLAGRPDVAGEVAAVLLPRTEHPGGAPFRAELLRYSRAPGCPASRSRAARSLGRGPARRLARAAAARARPAIRTSGRSSWPSRASRSRRSRPCAKLDGLGAAAAAALGARAAAGDGRRACRGGPQQATRANPAGLTERQLDVLGLLERGHDATPRSPTGWWSPSAPSTTTSPPCSASWACARGGRRPPRRTSWGSTSSRLSQPDDVGREARGVDAVVASQRVDRQRVERDLGVADAELDRQPGHGQRAAEQLLAGDRDRVVAARCRRSRCGRPRRRRSAFRGPAPGWR